jgi:hypothetical protein
MKRSLSMLGLFVAIARAAAAQPAIEVRTAFGASNYLHGDIDYVAPTVLVAARVGGKRFAIEPEVAMAWRNETQTFPGAAFNGPVVVERAHTFHSLGVNAITRGRGRVSPFFGGGIGMYAERRRTTTDGTARALTFGARPGTQIVAGIDVRLAPRIKTLAQFRHEVRSFDDPGGGSVVQVFAGVAIALR